MNAVTKKKNLHKSSYTVHVRNGNTFYRKYYIKHLLHTMLDSSRKAQANRKHHRLPTLAIMQNLNFDSCKQTRVVSPRFTLLTFVTTSIG